MSLDPRFQSLLTSPVFKKTKKDTSKVKIDERFQAGLAKIIKDSSKSGTVDQYGRKIKKSKKAIKEMSTFYDIDTNRKDLQGNRNSGNTLDERLDYLTKLARGEIQESESESYSDHEDFIDSDSNTNSDDDINAYIGSDTHTFAIPQEESHTFTEVSSNRLAIQNCDWENVSAEDLMVILQSFCPTGKTSAVRKVTIYVSDFGKERMELESMYGPKGIWKTVQSDASDSDDDEDEDNLYENIITSDERILINKESYDGDFERVNNAIGLVMQEDLQYLGKASSEHISETSSKNKKGLDLDDRIDEIELRKYELSKLRYYFAIAECESESIVNTLYEELNDVELEHTSMILDMSIVPADVSFTGREIKDACTGVSSDSINNSYKPPDFVVNALQHTNVECSWDIEKQREKKLTNFSSWRNLNESELQQYIASSDSETSNNSKSKAKALRKMLLNDDDCSNSELNSNNDEEDEFFMEDEHNLQSDNNNDDDNEDQGEEDSKFNKSISYIPELEKGLLKSSKHNSNETPYESQLRKSAEKKKSRKTLLKAMKNNHKESQSNLNNNIEVNKRSEHLELLLDDNTVNNRHDYNMREIVLSEKNKKSKKKKQKKSDSVTNITSSLLEDDFKIDTSDSRFSKLFQGDSKYGIDKTASEYKQTPATREILELVTKSRNKLLNEPKQILSHDKSYITNDTSSSALDNSNILANKLKRKFKT